MLIYIKDDVDLFVFHCGSTATLRKCCDPGCLPPRKSMCRLGSLVSLLCIPSSCALLNEMFSKSFKKNYFFLTVLLSLSTSSAVTTDPHLHSVPVGVLILSPRFCLGGKRSTRPLPSWLTSEQRVLSWRKCR